MLRFCRLGRWPCPWRPDPPPPSAQAQGLSSWTDGGGVATGARSHRTGDALLCYMPDRPDAAAVSRFSTDARCGRARACRSGAPCGHAHVRRPAPARTRPVGLACRPACSDPSLRRALHTLRAGPPRHRHRRSRWCSGAGAAGRGRAIRRPRRWPAGRLARARGWTRVELRTCRIGGVGWRHRGAGSADRCAAERARRGIEPAAPRGAPARGVCRSPWPTWR